jgi:hypothetical protein
LDHNVSRIATGTAAHSTDNTSVAARSCTCTCATSNLGHAAIRGTVTVTAYKRGVTSGISGSCRS